MEQLPDPGAPRAVLIPAIDAALADIQRQATPRGRLTLARWLLQIYRKNSGYDPGCVETNGESVIALERDVREIAPVLDAPTATGVTDVPPQLLTRLGAIARACADCPPLQAIGPMVIDPPDDDPPDEPPPKPTRQPRGPRL